MFSAIVDSQWKAESHRVLTRSLKNFSTQVFLFAFCLVATTSSAAAEIDRAKFIQMSISIAKVEAVDAQGRIGVGTAVTVAPGWVATNCHVTRNGQELRVVKGGARFGVTAQLADEKHDVCLLKVPSWRIAAVELGSTKDLKRKQTVAGLGFVGGLELSLRDGEIVGLHQLDKAKVIQTDASFTSGASGGGLFDDEGKLVGLMTFRLRGGDNHYFVVPVEWLKLLLDRKSEATEISELTAGSSFWEQKAVNQPYFLQAIALKQSRDWEKLTSLAELWTKADPLNAEAWLASGEGLLNVSRLKQAIEPLERALSLDQYLAQAWYVLGVCSVRTGDLERALTAFGRLDTLDMDLAKQLKVLLPVTK
jgi:serine protease Do